MWMVWLKPLSTCSAQLVYWSSRARDHLEHSEQQMPLEVDGVHEHVAEIKEFRVNRTLVLAVLIVLIVLVVLVVLVVRVVLVVLVA